MELTGSEIGADTHELTMKALRERILRSSSTKEASREAVEDRTSRRCSVFVRLGPIGAPVAGGRRNHAAARFLFAERSDVFAHGRDRENQEPQNGLLPRLGPVHEGFRLLHRLLQGRKNNGLLRL